MVSMCVVQCMTLAQRELAAKLKEISCYDTLPKSQKLIVFDGTLAVKKALSCLLQHGKHSNQ